MLLTLIVFAAILGFLVFAHEFGHFIVARKMGVRAEEFGFGFPPRIIGIQRIKNGRAERAQSHAERGGKWRLVWGNKPVSDCEDGGPALSSLGEGGTIYSLNWIPLGGFVKIKGESGEFHHDEDSFSAKKMWQRASILSAGVLMNVVAAVVILSIGFNIGLPRTIDENNLSPYAKIENRHLELVEILETSPAAEAGLAIGDIVVGADGADFVSGGEFADYLKNKLNAPVNLEIKRGGEVFKKEVTPTVLSETGEPGIGVGFLEIGNISYPFPLSVWNGFLETGFYIKEIVKAFAGIIHNFIAGEKVSVDITGPVGIAVFTGKVARLGFAYLLQFTALLSVNLALINIFPFPALDGGRLFFIAIEWLRRRPVSQRIENFTHNIGFALLMLLVLVVTYRDIVRFSGSFLDKFKQILH